MYNFVDYFYDLGPNKLERNFKIINVFKGIISLGGQIYVVYGEART